MSDDYMSDEILNGITESSTGIAKSREHRRLLNINARFEETREEIRRKRMTPAEREKERRDEALAQPISEESKGFALLAKMGFKPGMTLGKQREDDDRPKLSAPIVIEVKANRKGLGHEKHEENERNERVEMHLKAMKERAEQHEELIDDFRKRRRVESTVKTVLKDLHTCRKACEELDLRINQRLPRESWFWRSFKIKKETDVVVSSLFGAAEQQEEEKYQYSNGLDAPPEIDYSTFDEEAIRSRLQKIVEYLRDQHFYCSWCGAQYEDADDLAENCPGDSRTSHDSNDYHDD
ncbi:unnamed protein product [Caenorhabditis bovis]|uniref:G patch domain-containing protein 11 n=1 Tax=Caenorhabditis bovis TaxID=2654633 RepID=A0A8S1E653_9PELO|nr:unnamed protein product [Caenorhabditis bovis]